MYHLIVYIYNIETVFLIFHIDNMVLIMSILLTTSSKPLISLKLLKDILVIDTIRA